MSERRQALGAEIAAKRTDWERQIQELLKQQEKAYEKVQDIASKAVAGAKTHVYRVPEERREKATE